MVNHSRCREPSLCLATHTQGMPAEVRFAEPLPPAAIATLGGRRSVWVQGLMLCTVQAVCQVGTAGVLAGLLTFLRHSSHSLCNSLLFLQRVFSMLFGEFSILNIVAFWFLCNVSKTIYERDFCVKWQVCNERRKHTKKRSRKTLWHCQKVLRDLFDTRCRNRQSIAQRHQFFHRRAIRRQIRNLPVVCGDAVAPVCLPIVRCVHTVNGLVHAFASQLPSPQGVQSSPIIIVTRSRFVNIKNGWQSDHSMVY